jgi:hypothetical protein
MTAHNHSERTVIVRRHTQDGWDWPNGCSDEQWPVPRESSAEPAPCDCGVNELCIDEPTRQAL